MSMQHPDNNTLAELKRNFVAALSVLVVVGVGVAIIMAVLK
jgi:cytochrome b